MNEQNEKGFIHSLCKGLSVRFVLSSSDNCQQLIVVRIKGTFFSLETSYILGLGKTVTENLILTVRNTERACEIMHAWIANRRNVLDLMHFGLNLH